MANLSWGIDDPSVVTSFEIHGSDQEGFTPSSSTLEVTLPSTEREFITSSNFDYYLIVVKRSSGNDLVSQPVRSVQAEGGDTPVLSSQEEGAGITLNASGNISPHVSSDWVIVEDGESIGVSKNYLIYLEDESNLTSLNLAYYTGDDSSEGDELYPGSYEARVRFNGSGGMTTGWSDGYEFDVIALVDQPSILSAQVDEPQILSVSSSQFSSPSDSSDFHVNSQWQIRKEDGEVVNNVSSSSNLTEIEMQIPYEDFIWSMTSSVNSAASRVIKTSDSFPDRVYYNGAATNDFVAVRRREDGQSTSSPFTWNRTISDFTIYPNGDIVLSSSGFSNEVRRISSSGDIMWTNGRSDDPVTAITSSYGRYVTFIGTRGGRVMRIVNSSDSPFTWTYSGHRILGTVTEIRDLSADSNDNVYTAGSDGTSRKLTGDGDHVWTYDSGANIVRCVQTEKNGEYIVLGLSDGHVVKVDSNGNEVWRYDASSNVSGIDLSIDEDVYASLSNGTAIKLSKNGDLLFRYNDANALSDIAADPNGGGFYVRRSNGTARRVADYEFPTLYALVRYTGNSGNRSPWSAPFPFSQ